MNERQNQPESNINSIERGRKQNIWPDKLLRAFKILTGVAALSLTTDDGLSRQTEGYITRQPELALAQGLVTIQPDALHELGQENLPALAQDLLTFDFNKYNKALSEISGIPADHFFYQPLDGFEILSKEEFATRLQLPGAQGHYSSETHHIELNAAELGQGFLNHTSEQENKRHWHLVAHENTHRLDPTMDALIGTDDIFQEGSAELTTRLIQKKLFGENTGGAYELNLMLTYFFARLAGRQNFLHTYYSGGDLEKLFDSKLGSGTFRRLVDQNSEEQVMIRVMTYLEAQGYSIEKILAEGEQEVGFFSNIEIIRDTNSVIIGFILTEDIGQDESFYTTVSIKEMDAPVWSEGRLVSYSVQTGFEGVGGSLEKQIQDAAYRLAINTTGSIRYRKEREEWHSLKEIVSDANTYNVAEIFFDPSAYLNKYKEEYAKSDSAKRAQLRKKMSREIAIICQEAVALMKSTAQIEGVKAIRRWKQENGSKSTQ